MKYSIRGIIHTVDGSGAVALINQYVLWRLVTAETNNGDFTFEVWLNSEADKTALFNNLKTFVDTYTGSIDWHECTHDEVISSPCVIVETYSGG